MWSANEPPPPFISRFFISPVHPVFPVFRGQCFTEGVLVGWCKPPAASLYPPISIPPPLLYPPFFAFLWSPCKVSSPHLLFQPPSHLLPLPLPPQFTTPFVWSSHPVLDRAPIDRYPCFWSFPHSFYSKDSYSPSLP